MTRVLLSFLVALLIPATSFAAIATLNAPASKNQNQSFTVSAGSNTVFVLMVNFFSATDVTSVKLGGQSLTKFGSNFSFQGGARLMSMWYLVNPVASTTANIVVNPDVSGDEALIGTTFSGVDQVTPLLNQATALSTSVAVTISNSGSWWVGNGNFAGGTMTTGTGVVTRVTGATPSGLDSNGSVGTGSQTGGFNTSGSSANPAIMGAELKAAAAASVAPTFWWNWDF